MKTITLLLLVFALASCSGNENVYYLKSKYRAGLKVGEPVRMYLTNVEEVGKVEEITPTADNMVLIKINLKKDIKIGKGSRFSIHPIDLYGSRSIDITASKSKIYIEKGDTFPCDALPDSILNIRLSKKTVN